MVEACIGAGLRMNRFPECFLGSWAAWEKLSWVVPGPLLLLVRSWDVRFWFIDSVAFCACRLFAPSGVPEGLSLMRDAELVLPWPAPLTTSCWFKSPPSKTGASTDAYGGAFAGPPVPSRPWCELLLGPWDRVMFRWMKLTFFFYYGLLEMVPPALWSGAFLVGYFFTVICVMFEYILTPAWELKSQVLGVSLLSDGDLYLPSAEGR